LVLGFVVCGFAAYTVYNWIYEPNVSIEEENFKLTIPSKSSFQSVTELLAKEELIEDEKSFSFVAKLMKYDKTNVPAGQYEIKNGWSNRELISMLRSGNQKSVTVTFNNHRKIDEFAGKVSSYLEIDSLELLQYILDPHTLDTYEKDTQNVMSLFIPNSYKYFWNIDKEDLVQKLADEGEKFWSKNNREQKREMAGITREEVYTLASIVEKESLLKKEKPIIAGVYLNRIKRDIALQADPTVVFGVGDFTIRRVLNKHLEYDSPYNTYLYPGLPPGPIYMPSIESIDAVLEPKEHQYLYFCAKPGFDGGHLFAANLTAHNKNANDYHRWLNQQNIKR